MVGFGVCRLSLIPIRSESDHRSQMVSQLLFGEHYSVTEYQEDGKWLLISNGYDKYEGWIQIEQHHEITGDYFEQIQYSDYKICTDLFASILFNKHNVNILIGSILPISVNELFKMEEQLAFNGESKSLSQRMNFDYVKQTALKFAGAPYLWGGRSPLGIDCSGFIQLVFRIAGYFLPRDSTQQILHGELVPEITQVEGGDLVFFVDDNEKVDHVGLVLDNSEIIHASGHVRIDTMTEDGIVHSGYQRLTHKLHSVKRILAPPRQ